MAKAKVAKRKAAPAAKRVSQGKASARAGKARKAAPEGLDGDHQHHLIGIGAQVIGRSRDARGAGDATQAEERRPFERSQLGVLAKPPHAATLLRGGRAIGIKRGYGTQRPALRWIGSEVK